MSGILKERTTYQVHSCDVNTCYDYGVILNIFIYNRLWEKLCNTEPVTVIGK